MNNWRPYKPTTKQPWNFQRVWMLRRRAGFGATWSELQRDLADGPQKSVDRLLTGASRIAGMPYNFADMRAVLGDDAVASRRPERVIAWWIYQMYFTPDPLVERLSLVWHNHFATSNRKVKNLELMREQNEIFRQRCQGNFKDLLSDSIKHAAMLRWLDGDENRVGQPNENLGRELLELFTLGIGNYSEQDVKETSRALTGWAVSQDKFRQRDNWHDSGQKKILGTAGELTGDDVVDITVRHPATAKRIAWRLCDALFGENVVDAADLDQLAAGLRVHDLNIAWGVETILRSRLFYTEANIKRRIMDPETYVVGAVRVFEMFASPASTWVLGDWIEQMGRKLFYPPNVGGWPGGRQWLNSRTTIARANFASALVTGKLNRSGQPPNLIELAEKCIGKTDMASATEFYLQLLTGQKQENQIKNISAKAGAETTKQDEQIKNAVLLIMASPPAQLA